MRHQLTALLVAALAAVCAANTARAQIREWTVTLHSGEKIEDAIVVGLRGDSVLLDRGGLVRALPIDAVDSLHRDEGSNAVGGTFLGAGTGLLVGTLAGGLMIAADNRGDGPNPVILVGPVLGLVAGGVVGGNIGSGVRYLTTHRLDSMPPEERRRTLEALMERERRDSVVEASYAHNNVYAEVLGSGVFYSLNYEVMLSRKVALRAGVEYADRDLVVPVILHYLVFGGPGHLELGGGVVSRASMPDVPVPILTFGYRYQPQQRGVMFRLGFHQFVGRVAAGSLFEKGAPVGMSFGYSF
jgi:hypothetical protein